MSPLAHGADDCNETSPHMGYHPKTELAGQPEVPLASRPSSSSFKASLCSAAVQEAGWPGGAKAHHFPRLLSATSMLLLGR